MTVMCSWRLQAFPTPVLWWELKLIDLTLEEIGDPHHRLPKDTGWYESVCQCISSTMTASLPLPWTSLYDIVRNGLSTAFFLLRTRGPLFFLLLRVEEAAYAILCRFTAEMWYPQLCVILTYDHPTQVCLGYLTFLVYSEYYNCTRHFSPDSFSML